MKDLDIFDLYKLVQKKDKNAIEELYRRHKEKYPKHFVHNREYMIVDRKFIIHMMYIHLTK